MVSSGPVVQSAGRQDRAESHPSLHCQVREAGGVAPAGGVGVGRGDQQAGRVGRQHLQNLLQHGDGCRTHAAGSCGIQRVATVALDCCQAQSVDRRLAHRDAAQAAGAAGQTEQGLTAACREVAVVGAAHLNAGQKSDPVLVREPGAATGTFTDGVSHARGYQDVLRRSPLPGEVEPGR